MSISVFKDPVKINFYICPDYKTSSEQETASNHLNKKLLYKKWTQSRIIIYI
jgi:hypothetical protein